MNTREHFYYEKRCQHTVNFTTRGQMDAYIQEQNLSMECESLVQCLWEETDAREVLSSNPSTLNKLAYFGINYLEKTKNKSKGMTQFHRKLCQLFTTHKTTFLATLQVLRRLEATMMSMRNWSSGRANSTLHNWQVKEFLLITQCDLFNVQDCFEILQVCGSAADVIK